MSFVPLVGWLVAATVLWLAAAAISSRARLSGGPPTLPFIGNMHQLPRAGIHLHFTKWAKKYGAILPIKIGRGTMVVLSSPHDAVQILDRQAAYTSHRPPSYILGELVFKGDHPMFMDADERWKLRRKLYFQLVNEARCNAEHLGLIEAEATQLLLDICLEPESLMYHPGRYSNSIIMSLVFGIRTPRYDTPHYLELQRVVTEMSGLGEIGASPPVDWLPVLKYVPERFWGNWRTRAASLRKRILDLHAPLVERVIERRRNEIGHHGSFIDGVLDQQDKLQLAKTEIEIMCGNLLEGGTDTMATTLLVFCQAMATNPHVQEEAQREMDAVVSDTEMPCWNHREKLPYITMITKELLRWRPPAPESFPHALAKDAEIGGTRFPKATALIINIWGIHHDAKTYINPSTFDPSRFAHQPHPASVYANSQDASKRDHFGYGIGRRICPGIHLAERALFVAVARMVWGLTIRLQKDEHGDPIPLDVSPETAYSEGFLNQCRPFKVDVSPRSEGRKDVILTAKATADFDVFAKYS
ncbi:cytochrome P450 [Penicillium coprophilum]|uniref:cytochrome P450 n=1 Tax=Penicillium coprophilum TaxID=36646 RepID=UPI002389A55D|nr:cytochrome P450 [Penicillium coprophilum]KAJ5150462.1 cytochrome P450 [Penicillium coprophilum]